MNKYKDLLYIFMILFLVGGCKILEEKATEIKNNFGIKSSEEIIKKKNSIEIIFSCEEDSNIEKYIEEGWTIKKEYSEEKICSWKTVAATKDCDLEKDKGCKLVKPDKIGEERVYLLEK